MLGTLVIPALAVAIAIAIAVQPEAQWTSLVASLPCTHRVDSQLRAWRASGDVFRAPSGIDGTARYRIPTETLGIWITLEATPDAPVVRLYRSSASGGIALELDASCEATEHELPGLDETGGSVFTDEDLTARLLAHDRLVVYLWTPHLPLSVEGYHEIVEAASSRGASLIAVVDPSAEPDYVREVADAEGIPESARRRLASIELLFRNLAVHAPSILVFDQGRPRPVLPGYRSAKAYEDYLALAEGGRP